MFAKRKLRAHVNRAKSILSTMDSGLSSIIMDLSANGLPIDNHTILKSTPSWSAIRVISETVGTMPINVYRRSKGGREKLYDHPAQIALNKQPNPHCSPIDFKESLAVSLCIWGQAYIESDIYPSKIILQAIPKNHIKAEIKDGQPVYTLLRSGGNKVYQDGEIIPIKGFGEAGSLEGLPVYRYAAGSTSIAMAAEQYGAEFYKQGGRVKGAITHDKPLSPENKEKLRESLDYIKRNKDGLAILDGGMNYKEFGAKNNEAQYIETRKFQIAEAARIWRVPLSMLMEMDRATYSNSSQEDLQFLKHCLMPYLVRIEQALNRHLFSGSELSTHYCEFDTKALLRMDLASRAEAYQKLRNASAITPNEIRRAENMNDADGGDDLHVPLNMIPIDQLRKVNEIEND